MSRVDVVTVSYNSADGLRHCVEPLSRLDDTTVVVVDNASSDGSLETIGDLDVLSIAGDANVGFARGSNIGWRRGSAPYVLFLNPDAEIGASSIARLVETLEGDPQIGAVAPRIVNVDGSLAFSLRRFPRLRSTFAQAFFLHRAFPNALWADELIRDDSYYDRAWSPEWVSGACLMMRRSVLEQLGGWDERFFLFSEDVDLCRRLRDAGHVLWFDPAAICMHLGGASASKSAVLPLLAESRIKYIAKHHGSGRLALERFGMALSAVTHAIAGRGGRRGHIRSLLISASIAPPGSF